MQLKSEDFIYHENLDYSVYNRFQKNGLSEYDNNIYDKEGRILVKYSREYPGQFGLWNVLFETKYQYDNLITRAFKYKTGYTVESHTNPKWDNYGFEIENKETIYPLNELVEIEEIVCNENNYLILNKRTDLKANLITEKKYYYDEDENLIKEVESQNNQVISEINSSYIENKLEFVSNGIYKTYFKFNNNEKLIEIIVYELKLNDEILYGKIGFDFKDDICERINSEIFANDFFPHNDFDFFMYFFELLKVHLNQQINLPYDGYYINENYFHSVNKFEIVFEYYENKSLKQMTLYGDNIDEFIERRFYVYEYERSILKYVAGFSINNNEIQHLFSHKFKYYENI